MNVLHLINYAGGGGSEKYIEILKEHLEDINVSLACNEEGKLSDKFKEEGLPVYHVEMLRPFDFKAAKKLAKICNDNEIDIIHSHYLRENYISILSKMFYHNKAKIVYTCHFNNEDSFIVRMMNKIFYKNLDMIIAISKTVGDTLLKNGSPEDKIKVIYHGMPDTDKCAPQKEARDKFGVADDEFVISCGSRFSPEKGNKFLIRSIDKLNKK
ncbi:MAG: glycosyltransferase [Clostridia bacterium]|nr:glycosyltransferase [Clostridia bacterium]